MSVSFDGKPFEYRDPKAFNVFATRGRGGQKPYNRFAIDYLNPLYDYSKGQVADAASYLGIKNINSAREAEAVLQQIRNPGSSKAQQQAEAQRQQSAAQSQADIARQLKIVQEEKSAVAKMQQDYSDMLIREAEARKKAQEEEKAMFRARQANQAMAGRAGALQIQGAGTTPRTAGTQQFRRRKAQFGTTTPYTGLSKIQSGMVNV
tara:strand:+ start:45 stop:662 length:618 start_codon:yes stop_codon:yes gene_type:complete